MPEWLRSLVQVDPISAAIATAALVVSAIALRRQTTQWREGGPLATCAIYPGESGPGSMTVGVHVKSAPDGGRGARTRVSLPVVVLAVSGTGRLPIYVASVRFETTHRFRATEWRWWRPWLKTQLMWLGLPVVGNLYDKVDAVQRKDFGFEWDPIYAIAAKAAEHGGPSTVRAVVVLGNGTAVRSGPLDMLDPLPLLSKLTPDTDRPPDVP